MPTADVPLFRPLPLLSNPHVQTVIGHFPAGGKIRSLRRSRWFPCQTAMPSPCTKIRLTTGSRAANAHLLIHGLGGCHRVEIHVSRGEATHRLVSSASIAWTSAARGQPGACSWRLYNAAVPTTWSHGVRRVRRKKPGFANLSRRLLLGGNIALKLAGEAADRRLRRAGRCRRCRRPDRLIAVPKFITSLSVLRSLLRPQLVRQVEAHAKVRPNSSVPRGRSR